MIRETVRNLRMKNTPAEIIFWNAVRNRKLYGNKFFRQHPIIFEIDGQKRFFIADYYCSQKKLVVEIDGSIHEKQIDYDELRTHIMNIIGIKVVRFKNEDIEQNLDSVLSELKKELSK